MLSSILFYIFLFLGFFFISNATNTNVECTTQSALVSQIHFNPGVKDYVQNIQVTGQTPFSDCTIGGVNSGTGELIINNNQLIPFSCFNIFTHNLTAYVSFSFDNNQKHYVTLIPSTNFILFPNNIASFLADVVYVGKISPKLNGVDTLKVVFNYQNDIVQADPALACLIFGLQGANGTAVLTIQ
jgi:hypothetical protein